MTSKTLAPRRVLIAEDETLVADVIQQQLERMGHSVAGRACDGKQAVDLARLLEPDVVLMDIEMPEIDGLEATRIIQEQCPRPVVLLTAHDSPGLALQAGEAGAGAYLLKPPHAREIERTIAIAVARFADLVELRRLNTQLRQAAEQIKTLRGMIPICSGCKRIRDDQDYWQVLEKYLMERSDVTFTHSLCPDCCRKFFPEELLGAPPVFIAPPAPRPRPPAPPA